MKTITELNTKIYYRFVKVIFIILMLVVAGISVAVAFSEVGSHQDDFNVACNYGNKNTFTAYKDKGIYISTYYDYSTSLADLSESAKKELQTACGISKDEMTTKFDAIFNGTDDGKKFFDLTPTKVVTSTYFTASMWSLLAIVIVIIISELIRRAFYYVVLGSLRPHKK
jgi:hypothetical protein